MKHNCQSLIREGVKKLVFFLADLIFVTNITNIISGEKIVKWINFSFPCMTIVGKLKISPHVEKFQMSPHDKNKQCVQGHQELSRAIIH